MTKEGPVGFPSFVGFTCFFPNVWRCGTKEFWLRAIWDNIVLTMPPVIDQAPRARQLARAIVSDITLYNEAKITQGIQNDTLFDLISAEIEEGRTLFKSRVTPEMATAGFFEKALVDVLLRAKGHIKSKIW